MRVYTTQVPLETHRDFSVERVVFYRTLRRKLRRALGAVPSLAVSFDGHDLTVTTVRSDGCIQGASDPRILLDLVRPVYADAVRVTGFTSRVRLSALRAGAAWNHVAAYEQWLGAVLEYADGGE